MEGEKNPEKEKSMFYLLFFFQSVIILLEIIKMCINTVVRGLGHLHLKRSTFNTTSLSVPLGVGMCRTSPLSKSSQELPINAL